MPEVDETLPRPRVEPSTSAHTAASSPGWPSALLGFVLLPLSGGLIDVAARGTPPDVPFLLSFVAGTLLTAGFLIVSHGLLWYFLASRALGSFVTAAQSIRAVGHAFLQPGLAACVLGLLAIAGRFLAGNSALAQPFRGFRVLAALWAMYTVVSDARRSSAFTRTQTTLFVLWLLGLVVLFLFVLREFRSFVPV